MNSNNYIKFKIKELLKLIPDLEIYYEHDDFSESHFLKVLPLIEYENNNVYIQFEQDLNNDFFEKYPFELITFLSENDNYEMVNPQKITLQKESLNNLNITNHNFNFTLAIDSLLLDYNIEIPTSINFTAISNIAKFKNTYAETLIQIKGSVKNKKIFSAVSTIEPSILDSNSPVETNNITNNQDYSLAA